MPTIPETQNPDWGFFGTMNHATAAPAAWRLALPAIAEATSAAPDEVRAFLDSRHGRHFADSVTNELHGGSTLRTAIDAAIHRWMTWRLTRHIARQTGIPAGLPYLTGMVHSEASVLAQ